MKTVLSIRLAAVAVYLAYESAAWWLWVANSAFRGIRAPVDSGLGVRSVIAAALPPIAGGLGFYVSRRRSSAYPGAIACAAGAMIAMLIPIFLYSVALTFPF